MTLQRNRMASAMASTTDRAASMMERTAALELILTVNYAMEQNAFAILRVNISACHHMIRWRKIAMTISLGSKTGRVMI